MAPHALHHSLQSSVVTLDTFKGLIWQFHSSLHESQHKAIAGGTDEPWHLFGNISDLSPGKEQTSEDGTSSWWMVASGFTGRIF